MPEVVEIMDKDDSKALFYPLIKEDGGERTIPPVSRDILLPDMGETSYFPLNFCMEDIVINSIAKKYHADTANYPVDDEDIEHFLIGTEACQKGRRFLDCQYMKCAFERIGRRIRVGDIFAVYLLGLNDSDENLQKFLVMTKKSLFVLYNGEEILSFGYQDVRISSDEGCPGLELFGKPLGYENFDERFISFFEEFMLLRRTTLADVRARHPFAHSLDGKNDPDIFTELFGEGYDSSIKPSVKRRMTYLRFIVDAAAAEGQLDAATMLKIMYMAREFHVRAEALRSWMKEAYAGGMSAKTLTTLFGESISDIGEEYLSAFYQDLMDAMTAPDGSCRRETLRKLLVRRAGKEYVEEYTKYIKAYRDAGVLLKRALLVSSEKVGRTGRENRMKGALLMTDYNTRMSLQILAMGVILNG